MLATTFFSILVNKNLIFFIFWDLYPALVFYFKKRKFLKSWKKIRIEKKKKIILKTLGQEIIDKIDKNEKIDDEKMNELYEIEKRLILEEQIEL